MKSAAILLMLLLTNCAANAQKRFVTVRDPSRYSEKNIDVKLFRTFNDINSSFLHTLTGITNESVVPVSIAAPLGMYTASRISGNHYDESSSILLALSELTNEIATQGLKYLIKRDRPFRKLNNVKLYDTSSVKGTYSFPSGHSSGSFVIATSLTLRYPDNPYLIAGLFTYSTLVSLGRIYWGVHYPSDVLAGMLIGAGSAALIYSLRAPIIRAKNDLFNQSERTDTFKGGGSAVMITAGIIAADFINSMLQNSGSRFLSNSTISFSPQKNFGMINYKYGF